MACDLPKLIDEDTGEIVTWREGDTTPPLVLTLPGNQVVADYTLTLYVKRPDGTTLALVGIETGTRTAEFRWAADSLQAGPNQRAEIKRDDGSGEIWRTPPFLIDVDHKVGP